MCWLAGVATTERPQRRGLSCRNDRSHSLEASSLRPRCRQGAASEGPGRLCFPASLPASHGFLVCGSGTPHTLHCVFVSNFSFL